MPAQTRIQIRRDTAANWVTAQTAAGSTPLLTNGEQGYETDTGKYKIGNGSSLWGALPYVGVEKTNGTVTTASTSATVVRNITLSTSDPTGGADGDVWLKYTA